MARPRTSPLPRGITERRRARGIVYLISFQDQHGTTRQELAGPDLREAKRLLAQRRAEVEAGTYAPGATAGTTVATYSVAWLDARRERGVRSVESEARHFRLYILPTLGSVRLSDLRPRQVAAWIEGLRRDRPDLSAKTIINAHSTFRTMCEHARFAEIIVTNPASLPKGMLPRRSRKGGPRFERAELEALLTDERIGPDRRCVYALAGLTGMRIGEACGRRWRDLDTGPPELHALRVHSQYEDAPLKTARDDDNAERMIPVHPELARVLAEFRLGAYTFIYGHAPRPDDWIAADPRTGAPRTLAQIESALRRDCETIGIPERGTHAFRRAFISLARSDGARPDHLERVTHNACGSMLDVYTDLEWPALCAAVSCLRVNLRRGTVIALPKAANGPVLLDASLDAFELTPRDHYGKGWS